MLVTGATTRASPIMSIRESNILIGCSEGTLQSVYSLINVSAITWEECNEMKIR